MLGISMGLGLIASAICRILIFCAAATYTYLLLMDDKPTGYLFLSCIVIEAVMFTARWHISREKVIASLDDLQKKIDEDDL